MSKMDQARVAGDAEPQWEPLVLPTPTFYPMLMRATVVVTKCDKRGEDATADELAELAAWTRFLELYGGAIAARRPRFRPSLCGDMVHMALDADGNVVGVGDSPRAALAYTELHVLSCLGSPAEARRWFGETPPTELCELFPCVAGVVQLSGPPAVVAALARRLIKTSF